MGHDRRYAPATLRNRDFILDVLPTTGIILEVACGSGETSFIVRGISQVLFSNPPILIRTPY
jgi:hypothetical protein